MNTSTSIKHMWINFPTRTKQRCTRCGLIVERSRNGNYGNAYYRDGLRLESNPGCKKEIE
jgi:hypothetical protein